MHDFPQSLLFFWKIFFRRMQGIVATNNWKKEQLISRFGITENKIEVVRNAVSTELFSIQISQEKARESLALPKDAFILGYIGQLTTKGMEKGVLSILKAFKRVREDIHNAYCLIIGGSESDILFYKKEAEKLQIEDGVLFSGSVPHDKVPLYLKTFDVALMPFPREEHYAFFMSPIKMFEYMASGCPIIATNLPSVREVLNEKNACLVNGDIEEGIVRSTLLLQNDSSFRESLSKQALRDVSEYSWQGRSQKIKTFIEKKMLSV